MTSKLQHRSSGRRLGFWLAVAGLVHAEVLLLVGFGVYLFAPRDADLKSMAGRTGEQESIDVGMIDEDAAREIVADLEKQNEKDKAEEVKKEVESLHPPGQVVDIPAPAEERRPEDARFVSEHDTTVARETKKLGKFDDNAHAGDLRGTASKQQKPSPAGDGRLAMRTPELGRYLRPPGAAGGAARSGRPGSSYGAPNAGRPEPGGSVPELGADGSLQPPGGESLSGRGPDLMPTEEQRARRRRQGHAGRAQGHRRRGRDRAQLQALAVRFVLQPHQAPGRRTLAPRRGVPAARPHGRRLWPPQPLHGAAHLDQAGRQPEQRRARVAERARVPRRRGDPGVQGSGAVPESATSAGRVERHHQLRLRLPVRPERRAANALVSLLT